MVKQPRSETKQPRSETNLSKKTAKLSDDVVRVVEEGPIEIEIDEDHIRARAHSIWISEGRPHGRHVEHWMRARLELEQEQ
jgi:Protein of unknown function (DUF2934)